MSFASNIRPGAYVAPKDHVTSSTEVGGMANPKHLGQSGHPIPEPVMRTTLPARTTNEDMTSVAMASLRNNLGVRSRTVCSFGKMRELDGFYTI